MSARDARPLSAFIHSVFVSAKAYMITATGFCCLSLRSIHDFFNALPRLFRGQEEAWASNVHEPEHGRTQNHGRFLWKAVVQKLWLAGVDFVGRQPFTSSWSHECTIKVPEIILCNSERRFSFWVFKIQQVMTHFNKKKCKKLFNSLQKFIAW